MIAKSISVPSFLVLFSLVLACAPGSTILSPKEPSLPAVPPVPETRQPWEQEWSRAMAEAKKEKTVLIYTSHGYTLRGDITKVLKEKYGINLEVMAGKSAQVIEKFLSEQRVGLHLADLMISGSTSILTSLKPVGALAPLEPALMLPEVREARNWRGGQLDWVDKEKLILAFEASVSGKLGINTNLVNIDEIKSLRDLLNPKWKGKILMNDPSISGTGAKFFGVIAEQQGLDIWREITKMEPVVLRDERLLTDWLVHGKYAIIVSPKTGPFFEAAQAGAPIKFIRVKEGNYRTGDVISWMKDAPHPAAARVFLNWFLTREGQTLYHSAEGTWSARVDVEVVGDPATRPETGVTYFNGNSEEFLLRQPEHMEKAKQIFAPYMK